MFCTDSSYSSRLTIPETLNGQRVKKIGDKAFEYCKITSVQIPDSVEEIGKGAFHGCYELRSVVIPNSVTKIGDEAFDHCIALDAVFIPNSVTSIGWHAFRGSGISSISIPNSVIDLNGTAIDNCNYLRNVRVGSRNYNI